MSAAVEADANDTNGTNKTNVTTTTSITLTSTTTATTTTIFLQEAGKVTYYRLGDGDCLAPASRPVRGISTRDFLHGSCREVCATEDCLGYAYAPCERTCTIYGDPRMLFKGQDPNAWHAINGWGQISDTTKRCGSACFLRMAPCFDGKIRSAGATLKYGNITFRASQTVPCPWPYRGALELYCGLSGVEVVSGRCLRQCPGGSYFDRSFEVFYPSSLHGDSTSSGCPRGAQGNITMLCLDGEAKYANGRCGYNCQPGSLRAGSGIVMYPAMSHQAATPLDCPAGWTGGPVLRCFDSMVTLIEGKCDKHCVPGKILIEVGAAVDELPHGLIPHATSIMLPCPASTFAGKIMLKCFDGAVSLDASKGSCHRHCLPGGVSSGGKPNDDISIRRNVSHGSLLHGGEMNLTCKPGFMQWPEDQLYVIGVDDKLLYRIPLRLMSPTCGYGTAINEYKEVLCVVVAEKIMYVVGAQDNRIYRQTLSMVNPTSFWGETMSLTLLASYISISNGYIFALGALVLQVYKQKLDGMTQDSSWERLSDDTLPLTSITVVKNTIYASVGGSRIYKKDQLTPFAKWTGPISGAWTLPITSIQIVGDTFYAVASERVYVQNVSTMSLSSEWLGPLSGEQRVHAMTMDLVNESGEVPVWIPGFVGVLSVRCDDGDVQLLKGACKMHCSEGIMISNNVMLDYRNMSNGESINLTCPPTHTGILLTTCDDGSVSYRGTCGINCPASTVKSNSAVVDLPMINHNDDPAVFTTWQCPGPYVGNISVRCFMGALRWEGYCNKACTAGRWERPSSSAIVKYPQLNHTQKYSGKCEPKFPKLSYSGSVSFVCVDGEVKSTGGCYSDCTAGQIDNNNIKIDYGFIPVDTTLLVPCLPNDWYGIVSILCDLGSPKVVNGTCGMPCRPLIYTSSATRGFEMTMPDIKHQMSARVTCPREVSGQLYMSCDNKRLTVLEGSCGERCPSESLAVYGANFFTPAMQHLESFDQPCMTPYLGKVNVRCKLGKLNVTSGCKQGCWGGNVTIAGGALLRYPDLISGERFSISCPLEYAGFVTLQCGDQVPFVQAGECYKHCDPGRYFTDFWNVEHGQIFHSDTAEVKCDAAFDGYAVLKCNDGVVSLQDGGCYKRCTNGRFGVRLGIALRYAGLGHGAVSPSMECPEGYVGSVRLKCEMGVVSIGEGGCPAHCLAGAIQGARYKYMLHTENASLVCPVAGTLSVRCFDGVVTILGGKCFNGCPAGRLIDENKSSIEYGALEHLGNTTGTCAGNSTGYVQVNCTDTVMMLDPLPGQRCFKHCVAGTLNTSAGTKISTPAMQNGQRLPIKCPGTAGSVTVRCSDGGPYVFSGDCGPQNCPAGKTLVGQTEVQHPEINHGEETEKPSQCPGDFLGEATFSCSGAKAEVLNVSLLYPAIVNLSAKDFFAGNATPVFLAEHISEYFELCGCCVPAGLPPGSLPIKGVDMRKIILWAASVGSVGVLLATVSGLYVLRPKFLRFRKRSQIYPNEQAEAIKDEKPVEGKIVAYDGPEQDDGTLRMAGRTVQKPPRVQFLTDMPPDW